MRILRFILLTATALFFQASAQTQRAPSKFLCDKGGFICVPESARSTLLSNPLWLPIYVNTSQTTDLEWEIRDSTGKLINKDSTDQRMDWNEVGQERQNIFRMLEFILTPADSTRGTMTITPYVSSPNIAPKPLPALSFPVRLTTARSLITIKEPADPEAFQQQIYEWVDDPKKPFRTNVPFKQTRIDVMRFDPDAAIGMISSLVISRYPGQSQFYVTDWYRMGDTAYVAIDGSGWAGVSHYSSLLDYIVDKSLVTIPGIRHVQHVNSRRVPARQSVK